ncbi:MAG: hypothetical protein EHM64_13890 [Ignavibacteriae bacterium]|nr:MAG: hypothetical protein EHM64_13890 [Ignavibacteriota bacterium]
MKPPSFGTPILFLIFNRPDTTAQVFEKIREIRPRRLFISADGPRSGKPGERQKCEETRKIVKRVDWKCEVKTNFSEKNLGCRNGVSSGIDWFFNHVSEGIILEDDCLPELSFFHFCETLLGYYRNDDRVMHIGGVNFQDGATRGSGSYYFSKLNHIWGWATWKRAWDKYDVTVSSYPQLLEQNMLQTVFPDPAMCRFWRKNIELVHKMKKDTWDVQWQYAVSVNNGLSILPNVNLVSNIGYNLDATHTIDNFHALASRPTSPLDTFRHPLFVVPDLQADAYTMRKYLNPNKFKKLLQLIRRRLM